MCQALPIIRIKSAIVYLDLTCLNLVVNKPSSPILEMVNVSGSSFVQQNQNTVTFFSTFTVIHKSVKC